MIGRLILFVLSLVFGFMIYQTSESVIAQKFVVTEKVKTGDKLYLKYSSVNTTEAIFEATPDQYIDANEGALFTVYETQKMFWVWTVLCIICIILFFASMGADVTDMIEIIT